VSKPNPKRANQIAQTILEQMGGQRRLTTMLGAKNFIALPNGVSFRWPNRQRSKGNMVKVILRGDDTYDMQFLNAAKYDAKVVKEHKGIYVDQLVDLFEKQTGWYLRLGSDMGNLTKLRRLASGCGDDEILSRFEEGEDADPTSQMSPEDAKKWRDNTEKHKDQFKGASLDKLRGMVAKRKEVTGWMWVISKDSTGAILITLGDPRKPSSKIKARFSDPETAKWELGTWERDNIGRKVSPNHVIDLTGLAKSVPENWDEDFLAMQRTGALGKLRHLACGDEMLSRFEEGEDADPTKDMSPEDAKKWRDNTEKHKDQFKGAFRAMTAKQLPLVWVVTDPTGPDYELGDILFPATPQEVGLQALGAGRSHWAQLNVAFHDDERSARMDAESRLKGGRVSALGKLRKMADWTPGEKVEGGPGGDWGAGKKIEPPISGPGAGKGEGSDVPDGGENLQKRAGRERTTHTAAGTVSMYALVYGDGALYAATDNPQGNDYEGFWRSPVGDEGWAIYELRAVPLELAAQFKDQGSPAQAFSDGYEAWREAQPFATGIVFAADDLLEADDFRLHDMGHLRMAADRLLEIGYFQGKVARPASGLYGFPKKLQADCEAAARRIGKQASSLARTAYARNARTADFLATHSKRGKSLPAKVLVAALQEMAPKVATDPEKTARLQEFREAKHALYGYPTKVSSLGLRACSDLRQEAGRIASGLHRRRATSHGRISEYLKTHCKEAGCHHSQLLLDSYPDAEMKFAAMPVSGEWLSWEA